MVNLLVIFLCVVSIVPIVLVLREVYVRTKLKRIAFKKYKSFEPLLRKLTSGAMVSKEEILAIAEKPSLRLGLYLVLLGYHRHALFPVEFYTEEKGAESHLVNWLEFPTELGRAPDDILLLKLVTVNLALDVHYYVFRFRTSAPKWAGKLGWMLGVCGPYDETTLPFDNPKRIFSRFNSESVIDPEEEVKWVCKHILL
jgi:hypothetical protein